MYSDEMTMTTMTKLRHKDKRPQSK